MATVAQKRIGLGGAERFRAATRARTSVQSARPAPKAIGEPTRRLWSWCRARRLPPAAPRPCNLLCDQHLAYVLPVHDDARNRATIPVLSRGALEHNRTAGQQGFKLALTDARQPALAVALPVHLGRIDILNTDAPGIQVERVAVEHADGIGIGGRRRRRSAATRARITRECTSPPDPLPLTIRRGAPVEVRCAPSCPRRTMPPAGYLEPL